MPRDKNNWIHKLILHNCNTQNKDKYNIMQGSVFTFCGLKASLINPKPEGFKIHVSTNNLNFQEVYKKTINFCCQNFLDFKVVNSEKEIYKMFSKNYDLRQAGKFITIYPSSRKKAIKILDELTQLLDGYEGLEILSSRKYKDSNLVHYRYGKFIKSSKLEDVRVPYFFLPKGIKDLQNESPKELSLINYLESKNLKVNMNLSLNNFGGVYQLIDKEGEVFILKVARPFAGDQDQYRNFYSAIKTLKNETRIWKQFPQLHKFMSPLLWSANVENHYLILKKFIHSASALEMKSLTSPATQNAFKLSEFQWIFGEIIKIVIAFHKENLFLNDLSLDNFVYVFKTRKVYFVDWESTNNVDNQSKYRRLAFKEKIFYKEIPSLKDMRNYDKLKLVLAFLEWLNFDTVGALMHYRKNTLKDFINAIGDNLAIPKSITNSFQNLLTHPETTDLKEVLKSWEKITQNDKKQNDKVDLSVIAPQLDEYLKLEEVFTKLALDNEKKNWYQIIFDMTFAAELLLSENYWREKLPTQKLLNFYTQISSKENIALNGSNFVHFLKANLKISNGIYYWEFVENVYSPSLYFGTAFIVLIALSVAWKNNWYTDELKKFVLKITLFAAAKKALMSGSIGYAYLLFYAYNLTKDRDYLQQLEKIFANLFLFLEQSSKTKRISLHSMYERLNKKSMSGIGALIVIWNEYRKLTNQ